MSRDIYRKIAVDYLTVEDILRLCQVSKEFNKVFSYEIWQKLWLRDMSSVASLSPGPFYKKAHIEIKKIRNNYDKIIFRQYSPDQMVNLYAAKYGLDKLICDHNDSYDILRVATIYKQEHIVNMILENNDLKTPYWKFQDKDWKHEAIMFGAIESGDLLKVKEMVSLGVEKYDSGLVCAASNGNMEIVKYFISLGSTNYNDAMVSAIADGYSEIVLLMISLGANNYNFGLECACRNKRMELVNLMLSLGANDYNGALKSSASSGNYEIFEKILLLEDNLDYNASLQYAVIGGNMKIVDKLVELGANKYTKALHIASMYGRKDIAIKMLKLGAKGYSTSINTAKFYKHSDIVKLIEQYKSS